MSTATTHPRESTTATRSEPCGPVLYLALELGERTWKLAVTTGFGERPRVRAIPARDLAALDRELTRAQARRRLPPATPVVSCYEAGRDGFWLHRALVRRGIANRVVDSASIEVNRRARRAKADHLDAEKLVVMLVRAAQGDPRVWHEVGVPSEAAEDARTLHREFAAVTAARTAVRTRMHGLLATQGVTLALTGDVGAALGAVRRWDGTPLPPALLARLGREWAEVQHLTTRVLALRAARRALLRAAPEAAPNAMPDATDATEATETRARAQMRQLARLGAVGEAIATVLVREFFSWRTFRNGREVGALAGLVPTPYQSGTQHHEQGISKAGNRHVRHMAVELAWCWLRYQPQSALAQWYGAHFGGGGPGRRRVGVVALARKLLIALWRYLETGVVPDGARLKA